MRIKRRMLPVSCWSGPPPGGRGWLEKIGGYCNRWSVCLIGGLFVRRGEKNPQLQENEGKKTHTVNKTNSSVQKKDSGFVHCIHAAQIQAAVLFHSPAYSATHPPTNAFATFIGSSAALERKKKTEILRMGETCGK